MFVRTIIQLRYFSTLKWEFPSGTWIPKMLTIGTCCSSTNIHSDLKMVGGYIGENSKLREQDFRFEVPAYAILPRKTTNLVQPIARGTILLLPIFIDLPFVDFCQH